MTGGVLKLLHLVGVILWLGSTIGAWVSYTAAVREGQGARAAVWLERAIRVEHVGLGIAIASGVGLLFFYGYWPPSGWILWKLVIFVAVVLPFEIADLWIAHVWLPRALGTDPDRARARIDQWILVGGAPVLLAAIAILALATIRPAI